MTQWVKNLPAMQETQLQFLDLEASLEEGMTIHSTVGVWRIPWTEEPGGLQSIGGKESVRTEAAEHTYTVC